MIETAAGLLLVASLISANGFFVMVEFALVALDRSRVEQMAEGGDRRARTVVKVLERLSFHLSGAQLGITITSLILGFVAEPVVARALQPAIDLVPGLPEERTLALSIAVALGLSTVVQMVVGELIPKNWAIAHSVQLARASVPLHRWICVVFRPLISFLNRSADWTVRRLGIEPREELRAVRSLEEVDLLVRSSGAEGALDPADAELVSRSIRFREKCAADVLVPRTAVVSVGEGSSVTEMFGLSRDTHRSRFPVVGADLDDVRGVVHVKDGYRVSLADRDSTPVDEIMREPLVVPPSRDLRSLLGDLRAGGSQLAVVVDEYGGTDGILTLEDVLEEIVGDIEDEYDPAAGSGSSGPLTNGQGGEVRVAGTLHHDELLQATGFAMPDGPYETIAGFVLAELGHIPEPGEAVAYEGWLFRVAELDRRRISFVDVVAPPHGAAGAAGGAGAGGGGDERAER